MARLSAQATPIPETPPLPGTLTVNELRRRGWADAEPSATWGTGYISRSSAHGAVWVATHQLDPALLAPSFNLRRAPDALESWTESGTLHSLLKVDVLQPDEGEDLPPVSAHRLIKHFAVALGGVHHGDHTRGSVPELMRRAVDAAMPELHWVLRALGRIVVRAYEPLVCAALVTGGLTRARG